jgi:CRP/FNR family transcriptional regulator
MPAPIELLRRIPLFSELDNKELEGIANSMKERVFKSGDTITEEGKGGVGFFIIEDGRAKVTIRGEERASFGPGDYFGEIALVADVDRTATVTAESELRTWGMTFWDFRPIVEANASVAWKLLQVMARRLQAAEERAG